jgi:hypothetical protein
MILLYLINTCFLLALCTHIPNIIDLSPDKKILFKKQLFDLKVKGQGPTKVIMVHDSRSNNGFLNSIFLSGP